MVRLLSAGLVIVVAACASGGTPKPAAARCAPIVSDSLLSGVSVYPECGVDTRARALGGLMRPQYEPPRRLTCVSATLRVVVDAQGRVVPRTARLVRTNDHNLYSAMLNELPKMRYEAAMKNGQPVAQLTEIGWQASTLSAGRPGQC